MKKFISLSLVIVLCFSLLPFAYGEFDISVINGSEYYSYDKFEKTWRLGGYYLQECSNTSFVTVFLILHSKYVENNWGPEFRVVYYDEKTNTSIPVTSFVAYVDGALFSFGELGIAKQWSYTYGGTVTREFFNYLEGAQEVAFRIKAKDGKGNELTIDIDPVDIDSLYDLIQVNTLLEKSNAWLIDQDPDISDARVKASMDLSDARTKVRP